MSAADLPYERQEDNVKCGAASLCMIYRSLGLELTQSEVWPSITAEDHRGRLRARMFLLARDALNRGLHAVLFQARQPWSVLERCHAAGIRIVLNLRLRAGAPAGHCAVLAGFDADAALVHDPYWGPSLRRERGELLELLKRPEALADSSVSGNVLLALSGSAAPAGACPQCRGELPPVTYCPECLLPVPLTPALVLGCGTADCPERGWQRLFCPYCDASVWEVAGLPTAVSVPCEEDDVDKLKQMQQLSAAFSGYRARLEGLPPGALRDELSRFLKQLNDTHAQLTQELQKRDTDTAARAKDLLQEIQAKKDQLAAKAKARAEKAPQPAAPPAKPQKAIDPHLAAKLSKQVLEEFGQRAPIPHEEKVSRGQDLWDDMPSP